MIGYLLRQVDSRLDPFHRSFPSCCHNDDAARGTFEAVRGPNGPNCPHCGSFDTVVPLGSKSMGPGRYWCNKCREKFMVRVGSVMERSHIPMHKWLLAFRLMASSKKDISAHQRHRTLGVTYKTAWVMAHRIREAMRPTNDDSLGCEGRFAETDETHVGCKAKNRAYAETLPRYEAVMSLVERGGKVSSRHVADVTATTLKPILVEVIS